MLYRSNRIFLPQAGSRVMPKSIGLIGPTIPVRSQPYYDTTILTEVVDWPWSTDDAGVAFDQANLVGVRTATQGLNPVDGYGELQNYTAVPRVLPSGYTAVGRCGRVVPLVQNFMGSDPFYGPGPVWWRSATTELAPSASGYLWTPMNQNQRTYKLDPTGGVYSNVATTTVTSTEPPSSCNGFAGSTSTNSFRTTYIFPTAPNHIGFRGGKVRFGYYSNSSALACGMFWAGDFGIKIGYMNTLGATPVAPALPDVVLYSNSWTVADMVNVGSGLGPNGIGSYTYRWELDVTLPALSPPLGQIKEFFVFNDNHTAGFGDTKAQWVKLSPRTDVPLWYFASTGNLVAPGGTVT